MRIEAPLREIAYRLLNVKDKHYGVMSHRAAFRRFALADWKDIRLNSFDRLKAILKHAFLTSPYYHKLFTKHGFYPDSVTCPEDIRNIPFLTKDILEKNKSQMISGAIDPSNLELSYTGGTSGTHTSFYRDLQCRAARMGRQWGILERCGYTPGDRCGLIWGVHEDLPNPDVRTGLKRAVRKFASGKETLCCTVLSPTAMKDYHARLRSFQPSVLYGYPNAMSEFGGFIRAQGLDPINVRTIICTAERLTKEQRELLHGVFGGEVYNLYCTREHGCIGFECKEHNGFHLDLESVHLEIVSRGDLAEPGESGEIVITDLLNYGMPFIRSKIGDVGMLSPTPCNCGCDLPLLSSLDGRVTDMLYRPDGSTVAGVMLVDMFLDEPSIKTMQIVQEKLSEIDLFLVVTDAFSNSTRAKAIDELKDFMGPEVAINVKVVPEIPRNAVSGKFQEVICRIKPPFRF